MVSMVFVSLGVDAILENSVVLKKNIILYICRKMKCLQGYSRALILDI